MSISDTNIKRKTGDNVRIARIYLIVSICVAAFGAIYEYFSHGVYSYFMIYAFAIPLIGGALPHMMKRERKKTLADGSLWACALATLTIGSVMKGVLDIYGTTNSLIWIYPALATLLSLLSIIVAAIPTRMPAAIPLNIRTGK